VERVFLVFLQQRRNLLCTRQEKIKSRADKKGICILSRYL
jgi:hypothetical protein